MKRILLSFLALSLTFVAAAQNPKVVYIPDTPEYQVLKTDFHVHTVFSDGGVWPTIRVDEAVNEQLDAIALTEHIEHRPKLEEFTSHSHNRSYEIADPAAERAGVILVQGTEVTRGMPPGHLNAIFINDANVLESYILENRRDGSNIAETLREIKKQGAFVFWNHPNFPGNQPKAILHPIHKALIAEGLIDGIEVVNGRVPETEALNWCIDNGLTVMGTSDVHTTMGLYLENKNQTHRSMTLVLATERSAQAIREAMNARRTVALMNNGLYGREEHVRAIVDACLVVEPAQGGEQQASVQIRNQSSLTFTLELDGDADASVRAPRQVTIEPYSTAVVRVSAPVRRGEAPQSLPTTGRTLNYKVGNAFVRMDTPLVWTLNY